MESVTPPVKSPSNGSLSSWLDRVPWRACLSWTLFLVVVYELREFFFVAFVTFLLCYLVRAVVGRLSRRLAPGPPKVWLDRALTTATFVVMAGILVGVLWWIGPRFVDQGRTLLMRQRQFDPQETFQNVLDRTVGVVLMRREYGGPQDSRYQAALREYQENGRHGEGWYAQFSDLHAHLKAGFEAQYERQQRERIERSLHDGSATLDEFETWFLRFKAPQLFAERRQTYLAQWEAEQSASDGREPPPEQDREERRDEQIRRRILSDVKADPVVLTDLKNEWEQSVAAREWRRFQRSPEYAQAFRDYYEQRRQENPDGVPFSYETYESLRQAYPEGRDAFSDALQTRVSAPAPVSEAQVREDFELAKRRELTTAWWSADPTAAVIREHAKEDLPGLLAAVGQWLESLVSRLLTLPTQLVTALLLTLFICFDMLHLKESIGRLRKSRISHLYEELVPGLVIFARLIGRSFAAQGLIAVFNTLLSFVLLWLLGIENELFLCLFVFVGSFIPVLGVLLSSIPIAVQAVVQPDGSLGLVLQALVGILLIHLLETTFLSPKIVGKVLHLHPVVVVAILAIGEHFFGLWGLLLGVPVAVYLLRVVILKEPIPGIYQPATGAALPEPRG